MNPTRFRQCSRTLKKAPLQRRPEKGFVACLHMANMEWAVPWLSQLDPFLLLSLGQRDIVRAIGWINVAPPSPQPPIASHFHTYICSCLPCMLENKTHLCCSPVCSERGLRAHTQRPNFSSFKLFSSRLPSPLSSAGLSDLFLNVPARDFYHI